MAVFTSDFNLFLLRMPQCSLKKCCVRAHVSHTNDPQSYQQKQAFTFMQETDVMFQQVLEKALP